MLDMAIRQENVHVASIPIIGDDIQKSYQLSIQTQSPAFLHA